MQVQISHDLKERWDNVCLGVLIYSANVEGSSPQLVEFFQRTIDQLNNQYSMPEIADIPHVRSTRNAYKALGKSPSDYRNAAEAMLRRIVKSNGLYHINNVIDINNLMSVTTGYSIGSYDTEQLSELVELRRAPDGENYQGIGKEAVNIEHLPTLYDRLSAFGNPTSDSRRAMIQTGNRTIMTVIYSFDGKSDLQEVIDRYCELLRQYCCVEEIKTILVL
ncbi:B3/4 domain-containing protein [Desulfitobacterium sp. PCE1]|uniref:B3/B4 domain-containing protein n=1 Tax=Desulfitobacterium sp. PCE1 TaxID=146907 RepID=UPI000366A709|nr:phenylalanine--tRNA ligase beta subunit-related protein [Desulfitobacterium sp. PCE1]